jgi:hypothetical protein
MMELPRSDMASERRAADSETHLNRSQLLAVATNL